MGYSDRRAVSKQAIVNSSFCTGWTFRFWYSALARSWACFRDEFRLYVGRIPCDGLRSVPDFHLCFQKWTGPELDPVPWQNFLRTLCFSSSRVVSHGETSGRLSPRLPKIYRFLVFWAFTNGCHFRIVVPLSRDAISLPQG